jgi:hypothetical protein
VYQVRKTWGISIWEAVKRIDHLKTQDEVTLNSELNKNGVKVRH